MAVHVAYMGFATAARTREYRLRVQDAGVSHDFVRAISLEAFSARRARYQDAPEICFLKLQQELAECEGTLPDAYSSLTDSDLLEYVAAHEPKPRRRGPRPVAQS